MANSANHPSEVGETSSNPLMMDCGGGDLLLAGRMAGCWVTAPGLCVLALGSDLKPAWLSFGDESALEVSVT